MPMVLYIRVSPRIPPREGDPGEAGQRAKPIRAARVYAQETTDHQMKHHLPAADRPITDPPGIPAVHPRRTNPATRARRRLRPTARRHSDTATHIIERLDDHARQVRGQHRHKNRNLIKHPAWLPHGPTRPHQNTTSAAQPTRTVPHHWVSALCGQPAWFRATSHPALGR
jgi:hypothetical protein